MAQESPGTWRVKLQKVFLVLMATRVQRRDHRHREKNIELRKRWDGLTSFHPITICSSAAQSNSLTRDGGIVNRWRPRPKAIWKPSTHSYFLLIKQDMGKSIIHSHQLRSSQLAAKAPSWTKPLMTLKMCKGESIRSLCCVHSTLLETDGKTTGKR